MENLLLNIVLFLIYFSFACCFTYTSATTDLKATVPIEKQIQQMFQEIDSTIKEDAIALDLNIGIDSNLEAIDSTLKLVNLGLTPRKTVKFIYSTKEFTYVY